MALNQNRVSSIHEAIGFSAESSGLLMSPAFINLVLSNMPDMLFVKDSDFRIVVANPAFLALYPEDKRDQVIGYTTLEDYDDKQAEAFLTHDRLAFEKGESSVVETIDFPDGQRRALHTRKIRFEDESGAAFIVGISRDVTEITEGQIALAESDERFGLAVAGSAAGIWDWNFKTNEIFWSDNIKQQLGLGPDQKTFGLESGNPLVHPDDQEMIRTKLKSHLEDHAPFDIEYRIASDDEYRWVRACGQAIWNEEGVPTRMAGSLEEVTDHINAQEKLIHSMQRLDEFAHIASHDLRAPLRGVSSHVMMLQEDHGNDLAPEVNERLDAISELTMRADAMVSELLSYSRLAHTKERIAYVDLNTVVAEAVSALAIDDNDHIRVVQALPSIQTEPVAIRQLFQNLISNALKYNRSTEKHVEIGISDKRPAVDIVGDVFYVGDNGIGIAPKHHDQVFTIFRRLHSKDEFEGGTGAGLTFVKRIVERHGGQIWIESDEGCGTTFYFTLSS